MRIYLTKTIHFEDGSRPIIARLAFGKDLSLSFKDFVVFAVREVVYFLYEFTEPRTFLPCGYGYDQDGRIQHIVHNHGCLSDIKTVRNIKFTFNLTF